MSQLVGYQLVEVSSGAVIQSWGGIFGQCPGVPDLISCPNGDDVYNPELDTDYNGYKLVEWYMTPTPEYYREQNKTQASQLLSATDWTAIPSVADPAQSNPYLANQSAFLSYRSQVRAIAVNPPSIPVTDWPVLPVEEWITIPT